MFCNICGSEIIANARFCGKCGAPISTIYPSVTAMSCKICGAEIASDGKFCGKCGTPANTNYQPVISSQPPIGNTLFRQTQTLPVNSSLFKLFVAAAVLQVIMLILRFIPFGSYYVEAEFAGISREDGGTYSINEIFGKLGEPVVFIILLIASIAFCILPIVKNTLNNQNKMILPKIAAFWNAFMLCLGIIILGDAVSTAKEHYSYYIDEDIITASWNLTFGGWLNIIVTIAALVLFFVISKKTKMSANNY